MYSNYASIDSNGSLIPNNKYKTFNNYKQKLPEHNNMSLESFNNYDDDYNDYNEVEGFKNLNDQGFLKLVFVPQLSKEMPKQNKQPLVMGAQHDQKSIQKNIATNAAKVPPTAIGKKLPKCEPTIVYKNMQSTEQKNVEDSKTGKANQISIDKKPKVKPMNRKMQEKIINKMLQNIKIEKSVSKLKEELTKIGKSNKYDIDLKNKIMVATNVRINHLQSIQKFEKLKEQQNPFANLEGKKIRLKTYHNTYIQAKPSGKVSQGGPGDWEIFIVVKISENHWGFWNPTHKRFLRANENGKMDLSPKVEFAKNIPKNWEWTRFIIYFRHGGVFLQTTHNTAVLATRDGRMRHVKIPEGVGNANESRIWIKFIIEDLNDYITKKEQKQKQKQIIKQMEEGRLKEEKERRELLQKKLNKEQSIALSRINNSIERLKAEIKKIERKARLMLNQYKILMEQQRKMEANEIQLEVVKLINEAKNKLKEIDDLKKEKQNVKKPTVVYQPVPVGIKERVEVPVGINIIKKVPVQKIKHVPVAVKQKVHVPVKVPVPVKITEKVPVKVKIPYIV